MNLLENISTLQKETQTAVSVPVHMCIHTREGGGGPQELEAEKDVNMLTL